MNADGSGITRITNHPSEDTSPAWSPDGSKIAFVSRRNGNPDVYVVGFNGSAIVRLTDNPEWDFRPIWSLDGTKIAFISTRVGRWKI